MIEKWNEVFWTQLASVYSDLTLHAENLEVCAWDIQELIPGTCPFEILHHRGREKTK